MIQKSDIGGSAQGDLVKIFDANLSYNTNLQDRIKQLVQPGLIITLNATSDTGVGHSTSVYMNQNEEIFFYDPNENKSIKCNTLEDLHEIFMKSMDGFNSSTGKWKTEDNRLWKFGSKVWAVKGENADNFTTIKNYYSKLEKVALIDSKAKGIKDILTPKVALTDSKAEEIKETLAAIATLDDSTAEKIKKILITKKPLTDSEAEEIKERYTAKAVCHVSYAEEIKEKLTTIAALTDREAEDIKQQLIDIAALDDSKAEKIKDILITENSLDVSYAEEIKERLTAKAAPTDMEIEDIKNVCKEELKAKRKELLAKEEKTQTVANKNQEAKEKVRKERPAAKMQEIKEVSQVSQKVITQPDSSSSTQPKGKEKPELSIEDKIANFKAITITQHDNIIAPTQKQQTQQNFSVGIGGKY